MARGISGTVKDKQTLHLFSTHLLGFGKKLFPEKIPEDIKIIAIEAEDITLTLDRNSSHNPRKIQLDF